MQLSSTSAPTTVLKALQSILSRSDLKANLTFLEDAIVFSNNVDEHIHLIAKAILVLTGAYVLFKLFRYKFCHLTTT